MKMTWDQFRATRFSHTDNFFGVVTKDGEWVDSAVAFHTAVDFAACYEGRGNMSMTETLNEMSSLTVSIVHSSLLKVMYEAGILK